ncbi:E3 SUMO-protein ligase PIAS2 isoform X1 [Chiroxiphia lanceolata]|uniref:E3 SUMO-protein ligase PIAS2 isoform X1 n=1 Tax=Chiroxiphia lanceolata TaxID=296741 RepID=UPI0013CE96C8|nr:E3 SUMO-protein ligase PIAS2 isoform X1 [Chiroxiphia lanceolata]
MAADEKSAEACPADPKRESPQNGLEAAATRHQRKRRRGNRRYRKSQCKKKHQNLEGCQRLENMVSSFRVSELQVLLGFAGRNKSGRKHDLLMRALHLVKSGCSPAVQIKIRELYRRRYPRTIEGLSDLSAIKPAAFNLDSSSSPVEPDLAVSGIHTLPSTSVTPQSPSSPVRSVLLQDTKSHFEMQQPSPPIPPVHPDVQLKSLPFYDVLDVLIKPTSLVQSSIQRFQEKFFIFALTPQQVREICISRDFLPGGRRDYTVQVQLRLCLAETSCPQEDNYPNSLCIKVNGKLFPLPGYAPPPKNGIEQKRPGRPLNITSLVRLSSAVPNQISISWASEIGKSYSMSVYLVRQLTSAMLLQRLKLKGIRNPDHSRALIKEKLTADPDSEIATTSLRVSLMCPLGKMRLTIPCRAVTCTHLQCFDAALYLQMNEKKPTWICPVCDKKAAYESLILDGLFMEILNECSDVDEIKFQEDGSWCPMRPKKEAVKVSSSQCTKIESSSVVSKPCPVTVASEVNKKKVDVIDLTTESSSDEEEDPPAKRKCIFMSEIQGSPTKGVLMYQPSTARVPSVTTVDAVAIPPSLTEYPVPFHHPPISSISSDLPGLDFLSLIPVDSQQYCPPMFLDSLTSTLTSSTPGSIITSASHQESSTLVSSSGRAEPEAGVITSSSSSSAPDVISLDIISLD